MLSADGPFGTGGSGGGSGAFSGTALEASGTGSWARGGAGAATTGGAVDAGGADAQLSIIGATSSHAALGNEHTARVYVAASEAPRA